MKATCPVNPEHKTFSTTAHVMQEWKVDDEGHFVECLTECLQITHNPHIDNLWHCCECDNDGVTTQAKVEN